MKAVTGGGDFDFLKDLSFDLGNRFATHENRLDIIKFIEEEIDKEKWGITLSKRQYLILKCFYGMELDEEDISILESWKFNGRTSWEPKSELGKDHSYQSLILEAGRRSGKCQRLDNLVQTRVGLQYLYEVLGMAVNIESKTLSEYGLLTQKELVSKIKEKTVDNSAITIDIEVAVEGTNKVAKANSFYTKGISKTKKIVTFCGYNIEATPEHRIKIIDKDGVIKWRYIGEIKEGEYVCIHRSTGLFSEFYLDLSEFEYVSNNRAYNLKEVELPNKLNAELGQLLGLLTANGSWTKINCLQVTFHSQDIELYKQCYERNKIYGYREAYDSRSTYGARLEFNSAKYRGLLDYLGWYLKSQPNTKKTPWSIRQSPKDVQAAYLSGLFDGDGSVEKEGSCITLSTASKTLAVETQLLLLNFGIISTVIEKIIKEKPYYILRLRGQRSVKQFIKEIGFKLERKQKPVEEYLSKAKKDGGDTERIPYQIGWLKRIRDTLPQNMGQQPGSRKALTSYKGQVLETKRNLRLEYRAIVGNAIKESSGEQFSSYRLDELIRFAEEHSTDKEAIEHFKYLAECNYFYDPVESVEDSEAFCVDLSVPGCNEYVAQGMTNHNTLISSIIGAYEFYKLCSIPNPHSFFGIAGNSSIRGLVLATTADQSEKTIYGQISTLIPMIRFFKTLLDRKELSINTDRIAYKSKNCFLDAGNSSSAGQVGTNLLFLIMDEVARFDSGTSKSVENGLALELWDNLGISGVTFGEHAKRIAISSAWEEGDAIQRLYNDSKIESSSLGFQLRTWDMNPNLTRDTPLIRSQYLSNPAKAALEYEGVRSASGNAYFDHGQIKRAIRGKSVIKSEAPYISSDNFIYQDIAYVEPRGDIQTVMWLDPAVVTDGYGMAFGHLEYSDNFYVVIDGILDWIPKNGAFVSITNVFNTILQIHNSRPLSFVGLDNHNSIETSQRLNLVGIKSETKSATNAFQVEAYETVKNLMMEDRLILPKDSPYTSLLYDELCRLVQKVTRSGFKMDHPSSGTKDLADCVAGVCWKICQERKLYVGSQSMLSIKYLSTKKSNFFNFS